MPDYTKEQIEEMRAAVAAADAKRDAEYVSLVTDMVASKPYVGLMATLNSLKEQGGKNSVLSLHVTALTEIMPRLQSATQATAAMAAQPVATPTA